MVFSCLQDLPLKLLFHLYSKSLLQCYTHQGYQGFPTVVSRPALLYCV